MTINAIESEPLRIFTVRGTLSDDQLRQLVQYSKEDEEVKSNTRDANRFETVDKARMFFTNRDSVLCYAMTQGSNDSAPLLGLIWFEKMNIPDDVDIQPNIDIGKYRITFAIRIYQSARRKGLSSKFMAATFTSLTATEFYNNTLGGIWLSTKDNNTRASNLYEQFGFKLVATQNGRKYMIYDRI